MRGLEWGELYEKYHRQAYDSKAVSQKVRELLADEAVSDRKGIYEYVLGGCQNTRLLNIRLFDDRTKNPYAFWTAYSFYGMSISVTDFP